MVGLVPPPKKVVVTDERFLDDFSLRPNVIIREEDVAALPYEFYLFGFDLSYFTGKLECYLRYKELNFCRIEPTMRQVTTLHTTYTGCAEVPQLYDARGETATSKRWLRDTTSIIETLEEDENLRRRSPSPLNGKVVPVDPVERFFSFVVEDYADEALWRLGMYFRWVPTLDRHALSERFVFEFGRDFPIALPEGAIGPLMGLRQWLFSVFGEDIQTASKHKAMFEQYDRLLETLERILERSKYIGGDTPTILDFGFAGPLFRHCSSDPTPRKIMQQKAPNVYEWVARLFNTKHSKLMKKPLTESRETAEERMSNLLKLVRHDKYLEYLQLNAYAYKNGDKSFIFNGCTVPVVEFRVWCRAKLQKRYIDALDQAPAAASEIRLKLESLGMWQFLFANGDVLEVDIIECISSSNAAIPYVDPEFKPRNVIDPTTGKWPLEGIAMRYFRRKWLPSVVNHSIVFAILSYLNDNVFQHKYDLKQLTMLYLVLRLLRRYNYLSKH